MFNRQNKNIYIYWAKKNKKYTDDLSKLKKKLIYKKYIQYEFNKSKSHQIISTCILIGKKKGFSKKSKLSRHYTRNLLKDHFDFWTIKSW